MRSYPFIEEFFKNVLLKSKAIEGRFHVCPQYGIEITHDDLSQVLTDTFAPEPSKKYPLCLMMPPRSNGSFTRSLDEWEKYRATLFFLNTTFYTGNNQISNINPNTQTSTHTILQDWHDMKRCAIDFVRAIDTLQYDKQLVRDQFRMKAGSKAIEPISLKGPDRISGVRLDLEFEIFLGCEIHDIEPADISTIVIPPQDSHPAHKL